MNCKKGTTLIEVIIYIALFSILTTGSFVTAMQLIDSNNKTNKDITIQEEGSFFIRKITWALTGLDPLNPPAVTGSTCTQILTVNKINYPQNPIVIRINLNKIEMSEGGEAFMPITTINVLATCLQFKNIQTPQNSPFGVSATTTLNGVDFAVTKYIRK